MKKNFTLTLFLIFQLNLFGQVSLSTAITPRIVIEEVGTNTGQPVTQGRLNTYGLINANFIKDKFFFEVGFGIMQKNDQTYIREGTNYTGGGSGELTTYNYYTQYDYDYINFQTRVNLGGVFKMKKMTLFIGAGSQREYLINFKMRSAYGNHPGTISDIEVNPFEKPRVSVYFKMNPRFSLGKGLFFIELNTMVGYSLNKKAHITKFNASEKRLITPLFETGIGFGIKL